MRNFLASKLKKPLVKQFRELGVSGGNMDENIVENHDFERGLDGWSTSYSCVSTICDSTTLPQVGPHTGRYFARVSKRTQGWQGIEQVLTPRIICGAKYKVTAVVRIAGNSHSEDVSATVRLESKGSDTKYVRLGSVKASNEQWHELQGTLQLETLPERVVFYIEGPSGGVDILVDSVIIKPLQKPDVRPPQGGGSGDGLLQNPEFNEGLQGWSGRSCTLLLGEAANIPHVHACSGKHFAVASKRSQTWNGIEQEVTGRLRTNTMYEVLARVRLHACSQASEVLATLYVKKANMQEQYMTIGRANVSPRDWTTLQGSFTLHSVPKKAVIFLEGPPPGVDLLVDSFLVRPAKKVKPSPPPTFEDPKFGVNLIDNSSFRRGLSCWYPLGSCSLHIATGGPKLIPPAAKESLRHHGNFSGSYIVAAKRKFGWEGPAQKLTDKIQLFLPYQVSAWVRVGNGGRDIQKLNVALSVDGEWVTGGEAEVSSHSWSQISGSFRLEKKPSDVFVYVQGADPGVDIMVANLQIFSVDRSSHFAALKMQAEQFRKRDIVIRVRNSSHKPPSASVTLKVEQKKSGFPIGACINRNNLENSDYVDFFLKNFDCTVFENELKWNWTEPSPGKFNYSDADELCKFCSKHQVPVRGHCVFWEVESCNQGWLKNLTQQELDAAVGNRISSLVQRYKGVFQHYDVNNEMLHGDFFKGRLGEGCRAQMFHRIHQLDPSAKLFVNDYHVEDGREAASSPDKYVEQIQALLREGAPIGGVGIQGHLQVPIGSIQRQAFDKLGMLGLPLWITELDVCSSNDYVRADDLETVLREAFAHPSVEGVVLWGFWEGCCRQGGHLVDVDSLPNPAGKRLQELRREWSTSLSAQTNAQGEIALRGFYGRYTVTVEGRVGETVFDVVSGDGALIVDVVV